MQDLTGFVPSNSVVNSPINNIGMTSWVEKATSKIMEVLSRPFPAGDLMMPAVQGQFGSAVFLML